MANLKDTNIDGNLTLNGDISAKISNGNIASIFDSSNNEWNFPTTINTMGVVASASISASNLMLGRVNAQTSSSLYGNITLSGNGTLNIMSTSINLNSSAPLYLTPGSLYFNYSTSAQSFSSLTGAESWTEMEHFTTNYQYINSLPFYSENMTAYSFLMACPNYTSFITTVNEHGFSDCPYDGTFYGLAQVMTGSSNYRIMILWQNSGLNNYICTRNTNASSVTWRKLSVTNA